MISQSKQRLVARLHRPRDRIKQKLVVVEGPRANRELAASSAVVRWVLLGDRFAESPEGLALRATFEDRGVDVQVADDDQVRALGGTVSPQPIIAVAEEPPLPDPSRLDRGVLWLDQVQDPGNVGTLVRTAWALGLSGVVASKGTTDPWGSKVIRSSAGGVFRIPLLTHALDEDLDALVSRGFRVYFASAGAPTGQATEADEKWVLAVGNEGAGVSHALRERGTGVGIPMKAGVDSLNVAVAGSILMYVLGRSDLPLANPSPQT